jgi:thiol-disulfide isomerase/thioredoxin
MSDADEFNAVDQPPRKRSDAWWLAAAAIVLVAILISKLLSTTVPSRKATEYPGVGQPLPLLELQPLTGTTQGISLDDIRGKVTLINYWGPWCGYCIQEFPDLMQLWDEYRGKPDFEFLSVSSGGSMKEDVTELREQTKKFLISRGATFPTYVDADGASRQMLMSLVEMDGFGYPTTVLLDRSGIIRAVWIGYMPGSEREMEQVISKLLAEGEEKGSND